MNILSEMDCHLLSQVLGDVFDVVFILHGQNHIVNTVSMGGDAFFFDPANWES